MNVTEDAREPILTLFAHVFFMPAQYALNILPLDGRVEVWRSKYAKLRL